MKKHNHWGGKRNSSGRKRIPASKKMTRVTITLEPSQVKWLDQSGNRSEAIRLLLKQARIMSNRTD